MNDFNSILNMNPEPKMLTTEQFDKLLPKEVKEVLGMGCWLAGGALETLVHKDTKVSDYDLFFSSAWTHNETLIELLKMGCECTFACPEGQLFNFKTSKGKKIQLISKQFYDKPIRLISQFDFHCCMAAYDGTNLLLGDNFEKCVRDRILSINQITYPISTFRRLQKYVGKGYRVSSSTMKQIISAISAAVNLSIDAEGNVNFEQDELSFYPID